MDTVLSLPDVGQKQENFVVSFLKDFFQQLCCPYCVVHHNWIY